MANFFPLFLRHGATPTSAAAQPKPGIVHRLLAAVAEFHRQRPDRTIADHIAGGGFTDSAERDIERRFLFR